VYLQPQAPDPVLDDATVRALARRHVSGAERVVEVDESGGEARVYLLDGGNLDGGIVVKTQRPHPHPRYDRRPRGRRAVPASA
jgi:hypothetical protein